MWWAVLLVLASGASGRVHPDPLRPVELACLGGKTIVGLSEDAHLIRFDGTAWQKSALTEKMSRLWRVPDGRMFASDRGLVVELQEPDRVATRWSLREDGPLRVVMLKHQMYAASVKALYRLDPAGTVTFEGVTPLDPQGPRPHTPPVLLDSELGTIICTGSSATEATPIRGHCSGPNGHRYSYPAEFGLVPWPDEEGKGTEPFICSDVVISARTHGTQARQVSDGLQVGRAALYAQRGSRCLSNGRVFLVGRREVGVFQLPGLRSLWRRPLGGRGKVRDVALCGGKVAVLTSPSPAPVLIDVPADIVGK